MATNGLLSSKSVCINGNSNSNLYARTNGTGDAVITGDFTISGRLTVGATSTLFDNATIASNKNILMTSDISNSLGLINYTVSGAEYPLFPRFVDINVSGVITKQTVDTLVPSSVLTIPMDGYYAYTAQVNLVGVVGVVAGDMMSTFIDLSGGSLVALDGTNNIIDMTARAGEFSVASSGNIMTKLIAGEVIRLYHYEVGSFTFGVTSNIQVAYRYLGNDAI
jgi:hypothetical protein